MNYQLPRRPTGRPPDASHSKAAPTSKVRSSISAATRPSQELRRIPHLNTSRHRCEQTSRSLRTRYERSTTMPDQTRRVARKMYSTQSSSRHLWALDVDRDGRPYCAHLVLDPIPTTGDLRDSLETVCRKWYSWN